MMGGWRSLFSRLSTDRTGLAPRGRKLQNIFLRSFPPALRAGRLPGWTAGSVRGGTAFPSLPRGEHLHQRAAPSICRPLLTGPGLSCNLRPRHKDGAAMTRPEDHCGNPAPGSRQRLAGFAPAGSVQGWDALCSWVGLSSTPIVIVSRFMAIVEVNRPMSDLLAAQDGLAAVDGYLVAQRDTDRLRTAVLDSLADSPQLLHVDRPTSSGPPHAAAVTHLGSSIGTGVPDLCMIRVVDLSQPLSITPEALTRLYALTPAQAEIAIAIAEGKSLEAIVAERNIIIGTLRRHLHEVFRKTGTGTQGALIRLILSLDRLARF